MILTPRPCKRLVTLARGCKSLYNPIRQIINSKEVAAVNNDAASRFVL